VQELGIVRAALGSWGSASLSIKPDVAQANLNVECTATLRMERFSVPLSRQRLIPAVMTFVL